MLPALRRPVPEVAVVCDTSGSMSEDLLAAALAEVEGLLQALGLARQLRVLACDTAAAPAQRVTSARQVELAGGGGTDMGAGIAAAAALRPRPAVTVVLTDGLHAVAGGGRRRGCGWSSGCSGDGRARRAAVGPRRAGGGGLSAGRLASTAGRGDLLAGDEHQAGDSRS